MRLNSKLLSLWQIPKILQYMQYMHGIIQNMFDY